jgi:hypothetical protein
MKYTPILSEEEITQLKGRLHCKEKKLKACSICKIVLERELGAKYCAICAPYVITYGKNAARRNRALDILGARCVWCKCTARVALEFDHINNDGNVCRDAGEQMGNVHLEIIKNMGSDRIQILCNNCNMGKARNNGILPEELRDTRTNRQVATLKATLENRTGNWGRPRIPWDENKLKVLVLSNASTRTVCRELGISQGKAWRIMALARIELGLPFNKMPSKDRKEPQNV